MPPSVAPLRVTQRPVASVNWRPGPEPPRGVRAVVLHIAEGRAAAVDAWFANPAAVVSAHFLVTLAGAVRQYVGIHDVAFHAGRTLRPTWAGYVAGETNAATVGIEHEGDGVQPWPDAQLAASAVLCAWLCHRFSLAPSPRTLPLHREIYAAKTCPGPAFERGEHLGRVRQTLALASVTGVDVSSLITGIR